MDFRALYSSSKANLYRIDDGRTPLLLECGVRVREMKIALNFELSKIQGCLLTHSHLDHSRGAEELMRYGVDLYCSKETAETLGLTGHRLHIIEALKQFRVGTWTVKAFESEHDCPGSFGYLLFSGDEKLLFLTDSFYCRYRFAGLSIIAVECNYNPETLSPDIEPSVKNRLYKSHFSLENVKKFLLANDLSRVSEIHLLHLSQDNSDADLFCMEIQKLTGKPVYVAQERP